MTGTGRRLKKGPQVPLWWLTVRRTGRVGDWSGVHTDSGPPWFEDRDRRFPADYWTSDLDLRLYGPGRSYWCLSRPVFYFLDDRP